jgi:MFS family permease
MAQADSIWVVLRDRSFRSLWIGNVALNLTVWMQSVAAAWLMVSLTSSPLMVALIQTASALPSFFLGLPSGVMADLVDRRRYLVTVIGFMICSALALCAFTLSGSLSPWLLLGLTFCLGAGFALQGPAWYTVQTGAVPRLLLPSAMALSAVSYSSARAIGPALAGALVSSLGVAVVFMVNAALLGVTLVVILRWNGEKRASQLPPEDLLSGMRSALRYVRHSDVMRVQILRTVLFTTVASALWAMMPLIAQHQLGSGAGGYGVLLGSIGIGSVVGALLLPKLKYVAEMNRMMALCGIVYAGATLVAAHIPNLVIVCIALFLAGMAWVGIGNSNMLAMQSAVPGWIRARAVAIYMLVFQGAMAGGSALWGALAARAGTSSALLCSAVLMGGVLLVMNRFPARLGEEDETTGTSDALHAGPVSAGVPPDAPVAVQIVYKVEAEHRDEFLRRLYALGKARRRDGASFWRVYRDLEQECCYVERFITDSWDHYLRQRSRATVADLEAERRLWALHAGAAAPVISHYVSESCP